MSDLIEQLDKGLIVSCQAFDYEPMHDTSHIVALAECAEMGGCHALRINTPENVKAVKEACHLPVFGIYKVIPEEYIKKRDVIITPTLDTAIELDQAGADIIAVDCTLRSGRTKEDVLNLIGSMKKSVKALIMGEVSTLEEGLLAEEAGVDIISTTIAGYTYYSRDIEEPDYKLIQELVAHTKVPINAEGRFHTPEQVKKALELGAWTVTVGSAITRPHFITKQFISELEKEGYYSK